MTKSDDKRVPVLRFKGFTDEWEQRKLGDVAEIVGGGTPSTNISKYWNGNINWYSPTEIGSQTFVNSSKKKITELGLKESSAKLLPGKKTILFTSRAGIGDMAIMNTDGSTNQGFQSWIVKPNITDIYFLYSLGGNLKKQALRKASGSTFLEISNSEVKKLSLYLPNFKEQTIIGKIIKLIDKLITLQQRKLKLLKLMKNIVSYNLVVSHKLASNDEIKWKAVYLKDIARIYQPTTITKKDLLPKGIPVFGANDYIGFYNKYNHETDQVTICARGASAGHPNYVKGPVWITGNSMVINVDETYINKKFLYTLLTFTDLKRFVTGGAQPQITRENLNSLKILLPSIKAQNNLSAIIENLSINIRKVQLSINSAKRLKQFLLQNMFI